MTAAKVMSGRNLVPLTSGCLMAQVIHGVLAFALSCCIFPVGSSPLCRVNRAKCAGSDVLAGAENGCDEPGVTNIQDEQEKAVSLSPLPF